MITLNLTREQALDLQAYLMISAPYRKHEIESWNELANKLEAEGKPSKTAKSNAEFFRRQDATIREIAEILLKTQTGRDAI